jgi:hypothetical protein
MIKFEVGEIYEFKGFARAFNCGKDRFWMYKNTLIFVINIVKNNDNTNDKNIKCLILSLNRICNMYVINENDERWVKVT